MAIEPVIKNVKLFKGSGKNKEQIDQFEKMPKEKELKEYIRREYGAGFYFITFHDGKKPAKKIFVTDKMGSQSEPRQQNFQGNQQSDSSSEYLYNILKDELRFLKEKIDDISTKQNIVVDILREIVDSNESDEPEDDQESGVFAELLKKL